MKVRHKANKFRIFTIDKHIDLSVNLFFQQVNIYPTQPSKTSLNLFLSKTSQLYKQQQCHLDFLDVTTLLLVTNNHRTTGNDNFTGG